MGLERVSNRSDPGPPLSGAGTEKRVG